MEEAIQPQKKSKSPLIVAALIVAGLCGCVLLVLAVGTGFYFLNSPKTAEPVQPIYNDSDGYSGNADELLRADALNLIGIYEETQSGCADLSLVSGEMLLPSDQTDDGSWQETWQVNACGGLRVYTVSFTPTSGGTDVAVTLVK
jgi:hypothetical protein